MSYIDELKIKRAKLEAEDKKWKEIEAEEKRIAELQGAIKPRKYKPFYKIGGFFKGLWQGVVKLLSPDEKSRKVKSNKELEGFGKQAEETLRGIENAYGVNDASYLG